MTIRYFTDIEFRSGILITLGSDAAGDLYCRNQLGLLTRIGIGSNGQLLTALNGLPVWSSDRSPNGAAGGDLSGNYPNAVIANDAITFAKFQNIATQRLLGRNTAGSGDVEELTAATVRTILALGTAALLNTGVASGNIPVLDSNGKVNNSVISAAAGDLSGSYPTLTIINDAVTFAKFQNITTQRLLGRNTSGSGDVEELTAATVRTILALGTAALLNTGTAAGNVPVLDANGKLVSSLISLADDSVSFAKIQNIATQRMLGRNTAGSGDVEELPAATARTVLGLGSAALANTGTGINNVPTLDGAGLLDPYRLGLASPSSTTFLRGDRNWVALPFVPLPLTVVTGASQLMAVNNRYYAKNDTQRVNLTLPATATIGDAIHVRGAGFSGMGWRISNNTFTRVGFGGLYSEWGTGAYIESTDHNDCIELECVETVLNGADTYYIWMGVNSVGYLVMEVGS